MGSVADLDVAVFLDYKDPEQPAPSQPAPSQPGSSDPAPAEMVEQVHSPPSPDYGLGA